MSPPQNRQTREMIEAAAQIAANHAGPRINAAIEYVEQHAKMHALSFGVLPSAVIMGTYEEARTSQLTNLKDGKDKLRQMVEGLATVAYNYYTVEKANTITQEGNREIEVSEPKGGTGAYSEALNVIGGVTAPITLLTAIGLRPHWVFSIATKNASAKLCPIALISMSLYLLLEPDDGELGRAKESWKEAGSQIEQIGNLDQVMGISDAAWGNTNESRERFNTWLNSFQVELDNAKTAATSQADAIDGVISAVRGVQTAMLITDIACLTAMIAFKIMEMFPVTAVAGRALKIATAITNAVATGVVAGIILAWVGVWAVGARLIGNAAEFTTMNTEPGGKEVTFADLKDPMQGWADAPTENK